MQNLSQGQDIFKFHLDARLRLSFQRSRKKLQQLYFHQLFLIESESEFLGLERAKIFPSFELIGVFSLELKLCRGT